MTAPVEETLSGLTLEGKVAQLGTVRIGSLLEGGTFSREVAGDVVANGIGRVTRVGRESGLDPPELARAVADLQTYLCEETPGGIPALVREESLCGYAGRRGTTVPQSVGLAGAFDPDLARAVAGAVAGQLRAVGCTVTLSPVADLGREPRWGRTEETYGEDPRLAGRLATATVEGLQGGDDPVHATLKHFVGHGRPAGGRNRAPATASLRAMGDADLVPFRTAIEEADPASVMAAYHAVDGVPCHASERLLTGLLREEWGFEGTVVSDGRGIEQLHADHRVAADRREAGVLALRAGIDVELPETACFGERLVRAVREGDVAEALVDRAAARHLRQKARLGLLESPGRAVPDPDTADEPFGTDRIRDLARRAARRSMVLLENDGTLPLSPDVGTVAVVGPNADAPRALLGNYAYGAAESMDGTGPVVTPLSALRDRLDGDRVGHERGCGVREDEDRDAELSAAAALATDADVTVAVVGGRSGIDVERDSTGTAGEALDRADLRLPGRQRELVRAVAGTGTRLVVVLVNGRPLAIPDVARRADAVVEAWLPGERGGPALADVLFGTDPGGRLPVSLPRSVGQLPVHYDRTRVSAAGDYVFTDGSPLYPFGHGLSYGRVRYESFDLDAGRVPTDGTVTATVELRNDADRPATAVPQLYASDRVASVVRPVRELVGFRRVDLGAGERATLDVELPVSALSFHDAAGRRTVEPGAVGIEVGRSAADPQLTGAVDLVGEAVFPDGPPGLARVARQ